MPDDGDVVQGTNRIVAFVPGDGDVVQGNAVLPCVSSYKMTFWTNRIDKVVQGNAVCASRRGVVGEGDARQEVKIIRIWKDVTRTREENKIKRL